MEAKREAISRIPSKASIDPAVEAKLHSIVWRRRRSRSSSFFPFGNAHAESPLRRWVYTTTLFGLFGMDRRRCCRKSTGKGSTGKRNCELITSRKGAPVESRYTLVKQL